jgi:sugar-specific transcriptional regulator TrmB
MHRVGEVFDFGEYEIDAYLTVLEYGRLTATEIAAKTDIPQPRVYDTVRALARHGFVEIRESRPLQVLAVEPSRAFDGVQASLNELVMGLDERYTQPGRESEAVTLIKSRATIIRYIEEVIETAEFELVLSLTPELLSRFEELLRERREMGVNVDLLISPAERVPAPAEYDYTAIATAVRARRGVTTPIAAVADGGFSLYATRGALAEGEDRYGVVFDRSLLGFLVAAFLSTVVWNTGESLARAAIEAFPRRYASIRRCVDDIKRLDGPLRAAVRGRDVMTGETRQLEGAILDTQREGEAVASLTLETPDGEVRVGGRVAAMEDVEAHELTIDRAD